MRKTTLIILILISVVFTAIGCNKAETYQVAKDTNGNTAKKQNSATKETADTAGANQTSKATETKDVAAVKKDIPPADVVVEIKDDGFYPSEVEIKAGTRIIWQNTGKGYAKIHENSNAYISEKILPGKKLEGTFRTSGTFSYHNHSHETGVSMQGTIVIK